MYAMAVTFLKIPLRNRLMFTAHRLKTIKQHGSLLVEVILTKNRTIKLASTVQKIALPFWVFRLNN